MIGSRGSGVRGPPRRLLSRRDEVALRGRASAEGSASPRSRRGGRGMERCLDMGGGGRGGGRQPRAAPGGGGVWGGVGEGGGGGAGGRRPPPQGGGGYVDSSF